MLMAAMSTLHNLSRSIGCALLVLSGKTLLLTFVGGEMLLYLVWKVVRSDFMAWFPVGGPFGIVVSWFYRAVVKTIVDFSGCLQFR